jgi:hypothetical protein
MNDTISVWSTIECKRRGCMKKMPVHFKKKTRQDVVNVGWLTSPTQKRRTIKKKTCTALVSLSKSCQINKLRPPLRRPAEAIPLELPKMRNRVFTLVVVVVHDTLRVSIAEHPPVNLPIVHQFLRAPRMLAEEVLGVVPVAVVCDGAGSFDRLPAHRGGAERVVGFVVVVLAKGFTVKDIERFIGERFLVCNVSPR